MSASLGKRSKIQTPSYSGNSCPITFLTEFKTRMLEVGLPQTQWPLLLSTKLEASAADVWTNLVNERKHINQLDTNPIITWQDISDKLISVYSSFSQPKQLEDEYKNRYQGYDEPVSS